MSLHPIAVVDQVLEEYRSYLSTEFRARDERLRQALTEAIERPRFLAQDPFFQAHRPFKDGKNWGELGLDTRLARVMEQRTGSQSAYLHQSQAIERLLGPDPGPLAVTTGTGSGKTECFLLPVIQNAIEDSVRFGARGGLTALLVYPMNALANDQEERIEQYLRDSGHTHVRVERYDRSTDEAARAAMRQRPPQILLTNYMMLEYLLVRPADRTALFRDHRCRFLVLDEIHSYRGSLGANIALLLRRLRAHLTEAEQTFLTEDPTDPRRFPALLPVATSATIKSLDEMDPAATLSSTEIRRRRDVAVQEFVGKLSGYAPERFLVIGEEVAELAVPETARWTPAPVAVTPPDYRDADSVRRALATLAGLPASAPLSDAVAHAAILWKLHALLSQKPLSVEGVVERILAEVPERQGCEATAVTQEVTAALAIGAALPDGTPGALRLRTHRFLRGGWRFHRCVDPACGKLYAMGAESCECGKQTAPLYLCRSCGAHALRFVGTDAAEVDVLLPSEARSSETVFEWLLYERSNAGESDTENEDSDEGDDTPGRSDRSGNLVGTEKQMKKRPVKNGSFDPATCSFSTGDDYPIRVTLAPARNRCLCCGAATAAGSVLTPVALGTSAAVRVVSEGLVEGLSEQHKGQPGFDGKERLLIFADSRQDAAHQARFITYAGRYDRMRWRLVEILREHRDGLTLGDAVHALMVRGVERHDNRPAQDYRTDADLLPKDVQAKALAWEEAPLLDDIAVSAGYRATVLNLGLCGVRYEPLSRYVERQGAELRAALGLPSDGALVYVLRVVLDDMRVRRALSRPLLCYHPMNKSFPPALRDADWERRLTQPTGYPCDEAGRPLLHLDQSDIPSGVTLYNAWRLAKTGGRSPSLERKLVQLLGRLGGVRPDPEHMERVLAFLCAGPRLLIPNKLHGYGQSRELLQVNADCVTLHALKAEDRFRCTVCNVRMPWAFAGAPCPVCHGELRPWSERDVLSSRYARRVLNPTSLPLVAGEHTAQVTSTQRLKLESDFKAAPNVSPVNVLACSPTLEMGIDVGGLDAVVMRNVPPRPDNYAQRGGRAGRRSRVGVVLGYARNTPHDGYFYDKPEEMIAGAVPAPGVGLGNRDVVLRHLHALAFGSAEPGLSGRMGDYVTIQGALQSEKVEALINALSAQFDRAARLALMAWSQDILEPAGLHTFEALRTALDALPGKIRELLERVRLQIVQLQDSVKRWSEEGRGQRPAIYAMELKHKLLGIPSENKPRNGEADDRSSGNPMRRFAEFGLLPGYEFPSEPSTLRLLNDKDADEPISVERRFGIAQYQPDGRAHARGHRWRVVGLDPASPWNPKTEEPGWVYSRCKDCGLCYGAQQGICPRCQSTATVGRDNPGHEYGGFLAVRDDTPVLEEEDRYAISALVRCHPQRNGHPVWRYRLPTEWEAELSREEEVRWVNEWKPPTPSERERGIGIPGGGRGFFLCSSCGKTLTLPENEDPGKGRKKARKVTTERDPYGHFPNCSRAGERPHPIAITTSVKASTLRLVVPLPLDLDDAEYQRWGQSLGYALRIGIRHLYMLDGGEIEFELEPCWEVSDETGRHKVGALTFIDPAVGGSGFLDRAAAELNLVAARALDHLEHKECESACYRCLKNYQNQRVHEHLSWPRIMQDLEVLRARPPERLPVRPRDESNPSPWLAAYAAGVGSPLELRFLKLFGKHGLAVEKQTAISIRPGDAPITTADFTLPNAKVAIYIDGVAFHQGERLRRDRKLRAALRDAGWRVFEWTASDLGKGAALVAEVRAAQ